MINRWAAAAALLMVPAMALAQAPAKFFGDDGALSPDKGYNRLGAGGTSGIASSGNAIDFVGQNHRKRPGEDQRREPIVYERYRRNPDGSLMQPLQRETVRIEPNRSLEDPATQPNAKEWLEFIRDRLGRADGRPDVDWNGKPDTGGEIPLSNEPPRNKILVIDQAERKKLIDRGKKPEKTYKRRVRVVTRWTEARPKYENRTVVGYPCCCDITFSVLVGYDYIPHVDVTYRDEQVSDYPVTELAVNRGIVVTAGNPAYSTQIPRLCEFHYGPGATFTAPVVPLIANEDDQPDVTRSFQKVTSTDPSRTEGYATLTNVSFANGYTGTVNTIEDLNHRTVASSGTSSVTIPGGTTTISLPKTDPIVPGSNPQGTNYGGIALRDGQPTAIELPAEDRGVQTHIYTAANGTQVKDRAYVADLTTTAGTNTTAPDPYRFNVK